MKSDNSSIRVCRRLSLKDLVGGEDWQKMQDGFSSITNIGIRIIDPWGNNITSISGRPRLCSEIQSRPEQWSKFCKLCLPTFLGGEAVVNKNLSFVCHAGLHNFVVPLKVTTDKIVGYIVVGPVILVARKPKEKYRKIAKSLNIDLEEFWGMILEVKVTPFQWVQSLIDLLNNVIGCILEMAYKNIIRKKEMVMALHFQKSRKLLYALLNVASEISQADIGSLMFLDKNEEYLTIRASKGIPDRITRNTKVKLGERISGIAAKEARSLLIDDNIRNKKIRSYLNRPYIRSSMVIPIKAEGRVIGVINLGVSDRTSPKFNTDNVNIIKKLVNLTTAAMTSKGS